MRSPGAKNEFRGESTQPAITLILPQSSYTSSTTQIFLNVFISFIRAFLCHRAWLLLVHRCIGFCKSLDVLFCPLPMDVTRLFLDISKKTSRPKKLKQISQKLNISPTRIIFSSQKAHNLTDLAVKFIQTEVFLLNQA